MNPLGKFKTLPLMINVLLLFGIGSVLPDAGSVHRRVRLKGSHLEQSDSESRPATQASAEDYLEESGGEDMQLNESRTDHPDGALRFRRLQLQDEKGSIPSDGLQKAKLQVELMKRAQQERNKTGKRIVGIESSGIKPESWSWMGPGNIGGRIRTIVIHPTNPNTMWAGSVGGGIWRTDNGGVGWQPVNDFLANLAVSTMVINPANPSMMYAGTGEQFAGSFNTPGDGFTPDGLIGAGVFNSTDGGLSWSQLPNTNPGNPAVCAAPATPPACPWLYVNRLAISPDGSTLLAATGTNIERSTNSGANWSAGAGVVGTFFDIDFDPSNSLLAIAGANGAAVYSTNKGQSWTFASFSPAITGRVELAYAPSNPSIVYASVDQNNGDIYRSTNGGQSYTRVNTGTNFFLSGGTPPASQGNYDNVVWVNPQDATLVIAGGIDLWRSTNSGATFSQISQWQSAPGSSAHADHHAIVAHPGFNNTTNRIVYFGNDGGIYRADDASTVVQTAGWTPLNNNLGITQFYGAAGSPMSGVIIGGAQDNGNVRFSGGTETWAPIAGMGGDGGYCAADPTDSNYLYGEYIYLQIRRSNNGGISGGDISFGISDAKNAAAANFAAPFVLDPNDPNTMLAGGLSLWRSNNVKSFIPAPSWTAVPKPNPGSSFISAIAVSPSTSSIIAVGHNNGDIFLTSNGTASSPAWAQVDTANLPDRFVTRLTIDNTRSPSWIYATFGGFSADNVYRTTNFGSTWTDITGNGATGLPDVPVRSLVFHPRNSNLLYAGTEIGIFTSDDGGATWELPQNGPANVSVDELFWLGPDLIAATHGRGLYRASGGVYVDCNCMGLELGTFDHPFCTITAAVNASPTYRTIWIKPCPYFEPAIINTRVELRSLGGTAVITRP